MLIAKSSAQKTSPSFLQTQKDRIKVELSDLQVLDFCSHITAAANPVAWSRNLSVCICTISNSSPRKLFQT